MDPNESLFDAVEAGEVARVKELLPHYDRQKAHADGVLSHAWLQNADMIALLVELGTGVDERDSTNSTVLMSAAANGQMELVKLLIELGADIDAANDEHETPFSFACAWEHVEVAQYLYEQGADINCVHRTGGTPLDGTLSDEVRRFLVSIGAERAADLKGKEGSSEEN